MNINTHYINTHYSYKYSFLINDILQDWSYIQHNNTYLTPAYLRAIENSSQSSLSFVYVVIYHQQTPVGIMYFQCLEITHSFYFQDTFPTEINQKLSAKLLKSICGNLMMCGNFFATGVNGFIFNDPIPNTVVLEIVEHLKTSLKNIENPINTRFIMFKEFGIDQQPNLQDALVKSYTPFEIDVHMVLYLEAHWHTFQDYLQSMNTKYRTRAKSVLHKTSKVTQRVFTAEDIALYKTDIEKLYLSVVNTASFNMVQFTDNSFYLLKKELQDAFVFKGYFIDQKMVAFSTACFTNGCMDANYVGIDYSINKTIPLYQRVLYDYVLLAIQHQVKELRLGRTAEIMKSSLGAKPYAMSLYLKHTHKVVNTLLKPIIKKVKPSTYEVRKPFKKQVPEKI